MNLEAKTYVKPSIFERKHAISLYKLQCKNILDSAEPQGGIYFRMVLWDPEELEDDRPHKMKPWDPS